MDFQSLVDRKLEPVGKSNNDIIYRCPQCEGAEGSGHLYVDYNKGYFHCFKCNFSGKRIEALLKYLKVDINYDYDKLYDDRDRRLDDIISPKKKDQFKDRVVDYSTDLLALTEYYRLHSQPLSQIAYQYLMNRGLNQEQIDKLGITEGISRYGETFKIGSQEYIGRDYSGRIMVPSRRRDGTISFYVARDYIGDKAAKYLNPPKELAVASEDIWNLDMIDSESVIICEGVMTAIAASPIKLNAVATYGKSISSRANNDSGIKVTCQGEKLLARKFKNYYVAYDADAHLEALNSCRYLYDRGANVYLILIDPKKYGAKADVADIGYDEFLKLMREAVRYDGGLSSLML